MENKVGVWTLIIGCHKGTQSSCKISTEELDSLESCREVVGTVERFYRGLGYFIWFAEAISPNGEKVQIRERVIFLCSPTQ